MEEVVREFERETRAHLYYPTLVKSMPISRIMTDLLFSEASPKGLLRRISHEWYELTEKGKLYAVENAQSKGPE